ncbi:MAG: hypothetical protein U9N60_05765 [Thermodesulfobacteriota bacterium]|nr:hypothetical protein [Thermodesulfobacteriota bacterium]
MEIGENVDITILFQYYFVRAERSSSPEAKPSGAAPSCVPGTAHVLKGEVIIANRSIMSKSQTQPDGG